MRKGYHSYLIITRMFTGSFNIKQSDFPRKRTEKPKMLFSEVLHKLKYDGLCDVKNDKFTIKQHLSRIFPFVDLIQT